MKKVFLALVHGMKLVMENVEGKVNTGIPKLICKIGLKKIDLLCY